MNASTPTSVPTSSSTIPTALLPTNATPSLSPTERHQRHDSLEKHLQQRPDPQDLKNRNILLDTKAAPALQSAQLELERQLATDNLKKGLAQRPERGELVGRNILSDSTIAPSLQSQQKELQRHMRKDSLEKRLQSRPKAEDLVREGILTEDENPLNEG